MIESLKPNRTLTVRWLVIALLSIGNERVYAQFATVKGSITDRKSVKVVDSSVHYQNTDTKSIDVAKAPKGDYAIPTIEAGKYEVTACGMPFRPAHQNVTLAPEQIATINLVLKAPINNPRIRIVPDHMEDSTDKLLYLRDAKSGCPVERAQADSNGEYEFTNWLIGDDYCVLRRSKEKASEAYECWPLPVTP